MNEDTLYIGKSRNDHISQFQKISSLDSALNRKINHYNKKIDIGSCKFPKSPIDLFRSDKTPCYPVSGNIPIYGTKDDDKLEIDIDTIDTTYGFEYPTEIKIKTNNFTKYIKFKSDFRPDHKIENDLFRHNDENESYIIDYKPKHNFNPKKIHEKYSHSQSRPTISFEINSNKPNINKPNINKPNRHSKYDDSNKPKKTIDINRKKEENDNIRNTIMYGAIFANNNINTEELQQSSHIDIENELEQPDNIMSEDCNSHKRHNGLNDMNIQDRIRSISKRMRNIPKNPRPNIKPMNIDNDNTKENIRTRITNKLRTTFQSLHEKYLLKIMDLKERLRYILDIDADY